MLGFKVTENDPDKEYVKLEMNRSSSGFIAKKLKAALNLLAGNEPIKIVFEKEDIDSGLLDIISSGLDHSLIKKHEKGDDTETYYF